MPNPLLSAQILPLTSHSATHLTHTHTRTHMHARTHALMPCFLACLLISEHPVPSSLGENTGPTLCPGPSPLLSGSRLPSAHGPAGSLSCPGLSITDLDVGGLFLLQLLLPQAQARGEECPEKGWKGGVLLTAFLCLGLGFSLRSGRGPQAFCYLVQQGQPGLRSLRGERSSQRD